MKPFLIILALLFSVSCGAEESITPYVEKPQVTVRIPYRGNLTRPSTLCLRNILYYVVRESVARISSGYGYGFLAPVVDHRTLTYIRCRKENGKIIEEL